MNLAKKQLGFALSLVILIMAALIVAGAIGYYSYKISQEEKANFVNEEIKTPQFLISAGVVPHHLLAKDIIEAFFKYIASKGEPETIVLLSPDHFNAGSSIGNGFVSVGPDAQEFYGIKVEDSLIKNLALENNFVFNNSVVSLDHGITNLIPFVKKYFPESKIAPFIIPFDTSLEETEKFAHSLNSLASPKTIVIGSSDFSHYLPLSAAKFHDVKSIRTLVNFEKDSFEKLDVDSWQALYITRAFASLRNKEFPKIIAWANSVDFLNQNNQEKTTSYLSVVFENSQEIPYPDQVSDEGTILFVGDIMLDRGVEYLIQKNSVFYPFEKISQFLRGIDIVFGNLEGPIVKSPKEFPAGSLRFAFSSDVIEGLAFSSFNLLSLANNHTLNMGKQGLKETREFLKKANINFVGNPIKCDNDFSFEKGNLIFLSFNKILPSNCSNTEIEKIVERVKASNPKKFLIVIFHWGQEYKTKSSTSQQKLAHKIIDAGADVILGSHPHVVQEIEKYKGKLIFYSLGNFIFDQYFSKQTQQGLAVGLEVYSQRLVFRLFPIQSRLSQPFLMEPKAAQEFLENLAQRSSPQLLDKIKTGTIEIERSNK